MYRNFWIFITILILVSACTPSETVTPVSVIDNITATPSPIPTATRTSIPTSTPTATITPLPTIPTFTPTFDVSTIVTVTPAQKAECTVSKSDNTILEMDLTNDELPELVVKDSDSRLSYRILKCDENKYKTLFSINDENLYFMGYKFIDDANKNGIPEILFSKSRCDFSGCLGKIKVIE